MSAVQFHKKSTFQRGYSTIMVMVFASIMLLIVGAMLTYAKGFIQPDLNSMLLYNSIEMIKTNFAQLARNDKVWEATAAQNKSAGRMTCYQNAVTPCAAYSAVTGDEEIVMYTVNSAGTASAYYPSDGVLMPTPDSSAPLGTAYDGFSLDGTVCTNFYPRQFIPTTGSPKCIIHVRVKWRPFCASACYVPPEKILVLLNFTISEPTSASEISRMGLYRFNAGKVDGVVPTWNSFR